MNKTVTIAAAIGVVLALGFSLGAIPTGLNAQAQTEPTPFPSREKTISVTGQATTFVKPDRLNINFGVEVQKPTAKEALDENTAQMNEVIDAIKSAGINADEISTSQFTIYPVYESYQEKETGIYKQKLTGYSVSNIVHVKTPKMDLVSDIIDSAVKVGVNRVDGVSFSLSDAKQQQLSDDLLAQESQPTPEGTTPTHSGTPSIESAEPASKVAPQSPSDNFASQPSQPTGSELSTGQQIGAQQHQIPGPESIPTGSENTLHYFSPNAPVIGDPLHDMYLPIIIALSVGIIGLIIERIFSSRRKKTRNYQV